MLRQLIARVRRLGASVALRIAFSRMALPHAARVAHVDRLIVDLRTKLSMIDAAADREAAIAAAEAFEPLLKIRRGTIRAALASANDCWPVVEPMRMGRLTRLAARFVIAVWYPPGPARHAAIERFVSNVTSRIAVLHDVADREALIDQADAQVGPLFGLPSGSIRRRLMGHTNG